MKACIAAARRHPNVHAILYTKRIELLPELVDCPANLHARYSERETEKVITVWHCRNCAEHGCGCCGTGDIRFNVVDEDDWALRTEKR